MSFRSKSVSASRRLVAWALTRLGRGGSWARQERRDSIAYLGKYSRTADGVVGTSLIEKAVALGSSPTAARHAVKLPILARVCSANWNGRVAASSCSLKALASARETRRRNTSPFDASDTSVRFAEGGEVRQGDGT